jgi:hypothetical protein
MDIDKFKADIKELVSNNPQEVRFIISYSDNQREEFTKKKDFGLWLLDIFKEEELESITIRVIKIKGYFGQTNIGIDSAKKATDIEYIDFYVLTRKDAEAFREAQKKQDYFFYKNLGK